MTSYTKIINVFVADHGATDTGVGSMKHNFMVFKGVRCVSISSSNHVTEITVVAYFRRRSSVSFASRVVMRSSSLASFGEVTVLVDVESMLSFSESLKLSFNLNLLTFNLAHSAHGRDTRAVIGVKHTYSEMSHYFFC